MLCDEEHAILRLRSRPHEQGPRAGLDGLGVPVTTVRLELGEEGFWDAAASTVFTSAREARVPEQVAGICALTGVRSPAAILDLACGVGRHAVALATLGFSVTGVDVTPSYLEVAARRASEAGV